MKGKSIKTWIFVLVVASLVVAGCAPKPAATPTPTKAPEVAPTPTEAPPAKEVVDVIHFYSVGAGKQPLFAEWIEEFEKENPDIEVKITWGGTEVMTITRARLAAGDDPDVITHNAATIASFAQEGILMKLDDYYDKEMNWEGDKKWFDTFIPGAMKLAYIEDGKYGPGYYGIPYETYIYAIFYNKKIFRDLNLEIPKTWSKFLDVCQKIKDAGIEPLSADGNVPYYNDLWFTKLAARILGWEKFYDTALNKPGTSWVDEPGFLEAAKKVKELRDRGFLMEGYEGSGWPAAQIAWVNGETAMIFMATWLPSEIRDQTPEDFEMGIFLFPMVEGGKGDPTMVEFKYNGFCIPKGAKNPDGAIKFVRFWTNKKNMTEMAAAGPAPAATLGIEMPDSVADQTPILEKAQTVIGFHLFVQRDAPEWMDMVERPLDDQLFFGQISPEEFIEELQKAHDEYWETH